MAPLEQFSSYTGHKLNCVGRTIVDVSFGRTNRKLNLYVVDDDVDTLCGREWIAQFAREINFIKLFDTDNRDEYGKSDMFSPLSKA